ncbi:hypothetical protein D9M68_927570 [compost metagenome]
MIEGGVDVTCLNALDVANQVFQILSRQRVLELCNPLRFMRNRLKRALVRLLAAVFRLGEHPVAHLNLLDGLQTILGVDQGALSKAADTVSFTGFNERNLSVHSGIGTQ